MRLALVFSGCHHQGGVERLVWEAATHFARFHDVTVVAESVEGDGPPGTKVIGVEPSGPSWRHPLAFGSAARRALRGQVFDLVISFGAEYQGADVAWVNSVHRAWLERARHEPGSMIQRFGRYAVPRHLMVLAAERRYFRRRSLRHVISVSNAVTDDLARLYGVDRTIATTVHNGFDPDQFSPARRTSLRAEARAKFGVGESDIVLLIVANELRRKGLGTALDAVALLDDPRLHVLLVGRTPPGAFETRAETLGLADRFHYAGASEDVGFMHAAADLFVLPTQYEAFCLAVVEALASGLPVVTTAVPGAGDVVVDGRTGLIQAEPRSAEELARLLRQAMEPGVIAGWSAAAPGSVEHLAWPVVLAEAEEVLGRVRNSAPGHQ